MKPEEFNRHIKTVEEQFFEYDFQVADEFRKISEENEVDEAQRKQLETEFIAFRFMTRNDEGKRFMPVVEYTNGVVFPDEKEEVTRDRLSYWLKRAQETSNPVMKARYYDLTYEFNGGVNKLEIASKTILSYIEASKVSVAGNEIDRIDSITRAFLLAVEKKSDLIEEFQAAKQALIELCEQFSEDNLRWCLEILELAVAHPKVFSKKELKGLKTISEKGVEFYRAEDGSFMVLESYMKVDQGLAKLINPDDYDPKASVLANAQLYLNSAEDEKTPFLKQVHLMEAEQILRDGGLTGEANKVHDQMESAAKDPEFTSSFKKFSATFQFPQKEIDSLKDSFLNAPDKGELLGFAPVFMPSYTDAKKAAVDEGTFVTDIFQSRILNKDNMPIADYPDEKTRKIMRQYDSAVLVSSSVTEIVVFEALKNGDFTMDDIAQHIDKIKDLNEETYESVKRGFEHFFKGNYYEALSILLPQLEDLLADEAVALGFPRYRQKTVDTVEPRMLGSTLTALKRRIGKNSYHFLHYTLIDEIKGNLRNLNGHGEIKITDPHLDKKAVATLQAYMVVLAPLKKIEP